MTLRGPAAHLRGSDRRRSGDDSYWESRMSEAEGLQRVSHTHRAPRPQSATEGGQLDGWLQHLQRHPLTTPVHHQVPPFNERTTSMPALYREPARPALRSSGNLSFRRDSSFCGSSSLYGSSVGSQESLHTGLFSPTERRGSLERAHIMQAPRKEQAKLSSVVPVKTGWLPVQRRVPVSDICSPNQYLDHSPSQVKLKQPITPLFQKHAASSRHQDGEVGRSHGSQRGVAVRTQQTPDQASLLIKQGTHQVQEKTSSAANEWNRLLSWQALRRGWSGNRTSGVSQSHEPPTKSSSDPHKNNPLIRATGAGTYERAPLHRAASELWIARSQPQGTNGTEAAQLHTSNTRRTSLTTPPSGSEASYTQTTLIPQRNAGFSSITISSRKVTRSASLPGSKPPDYNHTRHSPSPPVTLNSMDPNSSQVTLQRRATIVKVTEHRTTSNPSQHAKHTENSPVNHGSDTVVHRRNATIIKVTEHRESYSPAKTEYRRSYTDGGYRQNGIFTQGELEHTPSHDHLASSETANSPGSPNTSNSVVPDNNDGTLHRSTLSLILGNPPLTEPVGQRSQRPSRPLSCYGNVFGHTESSETRPNARKWSFELPRDVHLVNPGGGSIRSGTALKEAGQTLKPNGDETERETPPQDTARRMSPCLTLIKAPDPGSQQSAEEVLALNAAAIIANIKLQRQLSKKKTPNGNSEKDSDEPPRGNSEVGKCTEPDPDPTPVQQQVRPHADFVPPRVDLSSSAKSLSLQEALQKCRPDFISRSQDRVRELEQRAQERRGGKLWDSADPQSDAAPRQKRDAGARLTSPRDNLFKPRDRAITGKEMQPRSRRNLAEVKLQTDEEQKRKACLSNRQRAELFKKKLLDQVLQRNNN